MTKLEYGRIKRRIIHNLMQLGFTSRAATKLCNKVLKLDKYNRIK